jgi:alkylhydroperoxidase family enzyme
LARREGWDEAVIEGLAEFEGLELEEATKAALRFAEQMTRGSHKVDDAVFAELRRHFDEGAVVEIAAVVGLFNYFNRFNNAFEIPPTQPGER